MSTLMLGCSHYVHQLVHKLHTTYGYSFGSASLKVVVPCWTKASAVGVEVGVGAGAGAGVACVGMNMSQKKDACLQETPCHTHCRATPRHATRCANATPRWVTLSNWYLATPTPTLTHSLEKVHTSLPWSQWYFAVSSTVPSLESNRGSAHNTVRNWHAKTRKYAYKGRCVKQNNGAIYGAKKRKRRLAHTHNNKNNAPVKARKVPTVDGDVTIHMQIRT